MTQCTQIIVFRPHITVGKSCSQLASNSIKPITVNNLDAKEKTKSQLGRLNSQISSFARAWVVSSINHTNDNDRNLEKRRH